MLMYSADVRSGKSVLITSQGLPHITHRLRAEQCDLHSIWDMDEHMNESDGGKSRTLGRQQRS